MTAKDLFSQACRVVERREARDVTVVLLNRTDFQNLRQEILRNPVFGLRDLVDDGGGMPDYLSEFQRLLKNKLDWEDSFLFRGVLVLTSPQITAPLFL